MAQKRSTGAYIWATSLPRLLTGENSCEWAGSFKAQHETSNWTRSRSDFDHTKWLLEHTALLGERKSRWESEGYTVFAKGQNTFRLRGRTTTLAGKPDLIAVRDNAAVIIDTKTGREGPAHAVQVMIYLYALPLTGDRYKELQLYGQVSYQDHTVDVPAAAVDQKFTDHLAALLRRIAGESPTARVPSAAEGRFCDITGADCPDRIDDEDAAEGDPDAF